MMSGLCCELEADAPDSRKSSNEIFLVFFNNYYYKVYTVIFHYQLITFLQDFSENLKHIFTTTNIVLPVAKGLVLINFLYFRFWLVLRQSNSERFDFWQTICDNSQQMVISTG